MNAWIWQLWRQVKLKRQSDDIELVVVLVYFPANATRRNERWRKLGQVSSAFQGSPVIISSDFNVTLEASNRPNGMRGRDPEDLWAFISEVALQEMGHVDWQHTWRSRTGLSMPSSLDRFLYSISWPTISLWQMCGHYRDHCQIILQLCGWQTRRGRSMYLKEDGLW